MCKKLVIKETLCQPIFSFPRSVNENHVTPFQRAVKVFLSSPKTPISATPDEFDVTHFTCTARAAFPWLQSRPSSSNTQDDWCLMQLGPPYNYTKVDFEGSISANFTNEDHPLNWVNFVRDYFQPFCVTSVIA